MHRHAAAQQDILQIDGSGFGVVAGDAIQCRAGFHPGSKQDGFYLEVQFDKAWAAERTRKLVTTELLGKAAIPNLPYEQPDGTPLRVNTDYFGKRRGESDPMPGPFESVGEGTLRVKVW